MAIFNSKLLVYQRVPCRWNWWNSTARIIPFGLVFITVDPIYTWRTQHHHPGKRERGTVRVRFLLVLQYVVGANSSYTSSCLMSLSRCLSKEDAATSQKVCEKIQIIGEGETVLIDYYTPVSQTIFNSCKCNPLSTHAHYEAFIHQIHCCLGKHLHFKIDLSLTSCNFPSRRGITSFKEEYSYKI